LLQHLAAAVLARHLGKARCAFQTNGFMAHLFEDQQVATWSAPKVEDAPRFRYFDVLQQGLDVLADVVVARARPELLGLAVVLLDREAGDAGQFFGAQAHGVRRFTSRSMNR
jgi:hypothetical protein